MIPHSWNVTKNGNTYDVRGKWTNWLSDNGWRKIIADIKSDRTITELPYDVRFPLTAQGECSILANGRFSMKRHIDEKNGSNSEPDLEMVVQALTQSNITGHIDPNHPERMVYPEAWPGASLRYGVWHGRGLRVEKVVEIDPERVSSGDLEYKFRLRSNKAKAFLKNGKRPWKGSVGDSLELNSDSLFLANDDSELRGITLRSAVAWYYEDHKLVTKSIKLQVIIINNETIEVTKLIPASVVLAARQAGSLLFTDATFYPDPHPETSTVDGLTTRNSGNQTWSALMSGAGTTKNDSGGNHTVNCGSVSGFDPTDRWYSITRFHALFDTSSLSGDVSSATLNFTSPSWGPLTENFSVTLGIYATSPASNTALANSDHNKANLGTSLFSATNPMADFAGGATVGFGFVSAGLLAIDVSGISKFVIRTVDDVAESAPTWPGTGGTSNFVILPAENTGTASDPKLEVTTAAIVVPETSSISSVKKIFLLRRR